MKYVYRTSINWHKSLFIAQSRLKGLSLYNNAMYLMVNSVAVSLFGFVFWNIMARFYPPTEVGIGSALVAATSLVSLLTTMGLGIGLIRYVPEINEKESIINLAFTLCVVATLAGASIYLGGVRYWSPNLGFVNGNFWFVIIFITITVFTSLNSLVDSCFVAGRVTRYVFIKNIFISLLKIPIPLIMIQHYYGFSIFAGAGGGILIGVLLACLLYIPRVYRGIILRPVIKKELIKIILPYSIANHMANIFNMAPQFVYPLMVMNVYGPEKSAYFWVAWMMTSVLTIIPNGMAQSLLAECSHNNYKINQNAIRALYFSFSASIIAVTCMIMFGGWFLRLFGQGYSQYGFPVVKYMALGVIPQCVNSIYLAVNQVKKRLCLINAQSCIITFISIGIGWLLLVRVGMQGLGIAYALAQLIVAIMVIIPFKRDITKK